MASAAKDFNEAAQEAKQKAVCVAEKAGEAIASAAKSAWEYCKENPMEVIHGALDIIGMIPGVGNIADGINAAIYLAEGDYVNAALSAVSLIPMGGALAAVGKVAAKSDGLIKMVAKYGDEVVEGVARYGDEIVEGIARHGDEVVEGVARYGDEATDAARRCVNGQCFVAGTLVLTAGGYKNIEDIEVGDKVIATDPETGETAVKEVKRVFENKTFELVHLTVNGETITSTPGHKYYAPEKGWVSAIELCIGDLLQLVNGEYVVVEVVQHEILEEPVTIYNFEVEDFHTYYVGEQSVLVHNAGCHNNDPQVQEFIRQFEERYPNRAYQSGHTVTHSDGRILEVDFETDNVIIEFKEGNGKGLTRQITDRLDPTANPGGKVVIGFTGKPTSKFVADGVERSGGLITSDMDLLLDVIAPD